MEYFSVIIPAFNMEPYIGAAVESALSQQRVKCEVIVVDDGSTDGTLGILKSFKKRVRIIRQEKTGPSAARNSGVQAAEGNVIAFLDADDVWLPDKLSTQSLKLRQGYSLVYSNRFNIGMTGDVPELHSDVVTMLEGDIWENLLFGNMITTSSSVIKRELYESVGGFKNGMHFCEDWDLWLRCAAKRAIGYCPEPLVKYRIHSGGLSSNYRYMKDMREQVILSALDSERGRALPFAGRQRVLAKTWSTSGWDAARAKDLGAAFKYYGTALRHWPFDHMIWYNLARAVAGRI